MGIGDWLRQHFGRTTTTSSRGSRPVARDDASAPSTRDPRVEAAVDAMLGQPEADQNRMLELLEDCGFTPLEAWRAYQFVPMAFAHVVFSERGVTFRKDYILMDPETGVRRTHRLSDEPIYVAAAMSARSRGATGRRAPKLLPVYGRSAEYGAILQLAGPDGRLDGVVLVEPILMTFGG